MFIEALYALYLKKYVICIFILFFCVPSVNHWYNYKCNSLSHKLDKLTATISVISYSIYHLSFAIYHKQYIKLIINMIYGIITVMCYNNSVYFINKKKSYWIYFHMMFHILLILHLYYLINYHFIN
jgi:hypothetical protein